jgi:hypothetical protein
VFPLHGRRTRYGWIGAREQTSVPLTRSRILIDCSLALCAGSQVSIRSLWGPEDCHRQGHKRINDNRYTCNQFGENRKGFVFIDP